MWAAVCEVARKALAASRRRAVVDRRRRPDRLRQRPLSHRSRRDSRSATPSFRPTSGRRRSSRAGAPTGPKPARSELTYNAQFPGKTLPLIAWLDANEPEGFERADRALFCKDYLRFRLTGEVGLEISDMSSAGLIDQRLRRWTPAALDPFGLGRYARLFGDGASR